MSRLIDADAMCADLATVDPRYEAMIDWCIRVTKAQPTVDAVEVVRCKDCKFNYANQIPSEDACQLCVELPISDEFYCAYGEREEDEVTE